MSHSSKSKYAISAAKARLATGADKDRRARAAELRAAGARLSVASDVPYTGPEYLRQIALRFAPAELPGSTVPLLWWTTSANYGDLLSPWLVGKLAQRPVTYAGTNGRTYLAVGSIAARARRESIVWGSGLSGSEVKWTVRPAQEYRAVRGPLTRAFLRNMGGDCPHVYGDPALLTPLYFWPDVEPEYEVGIVVRWSEKKWRDASIGPGVRLIDFGTDDVEGTTRAILSCKRIVSSSLHGLIIADAYGIPNAWMDSDAWAGGSRPAGGEFKFYDYMISVNKVRSPQDFDPLALPLEADRVIGQLTFDARPISFNYEALLDACPFVTR